jgi:hypothetical protein
MTGSITPARGRRADGLTDIFRLAILIAFPVIATWLAERMWRALVV